MKVLILTSYTPGNIYLVNKITGSKDVVAKVIEKRPGPATFADKMKVRWKLVKKHGFIKTANKLLYNKYRNRRITPNENAAMSELFGEGGAAEYRDDVPTIEVASVNSKECRDFIKSHSPDIIAVCGTGILKPGTFKLSGKGTINIHCGITPEYRSADPIFWALYNNEPDKVGVTIHFIDEGIDTGDIIYQKRVEVTGNDDLSTLYQKCIAEGAELMCKAISDIEKDDVATIKKDSVQSKAYYHIDLGLFEYLVFRRRFERLRRDLQRADDGSTANEKT